VEVAERPALRGVLSKASERRHKNVILVGHKIVQGCRGTLGSVGQHYGVSEDLSRRESDHPTFPTSGLLDRNSSSVPRFNQMGLRGSSIVSSVIDRGLERYSE
jgi:hypothetical protein